MLMLKKSLNIVNESDYLLDLKVIVLLLVIFIGKLFILQTIIRKKEINFC